MVRRSVIPKSPPGVLLAIIVSIGIIALVRWPAASDEHDVRRRTINDTLTEQQPAPTYAIVTLVTSNAKGVKLPDDVVLGAMAALRQSIVGAGGVESVALIHPDMAHLEDRLNRLGFTSLVQPPAFDVKHVRNEAIGREMAVDGALGVAELLKLEVLAWTKYRAVLVVDFDVAFHSNNIVTAIEGVLETNPNATLFYTRGNWDSEPINGGVLLFVPSSTRGVPHYRAMMEVLAEGDFRPGTGWKGSGFGWTYGGRTVQGILPYWYLHVLKGRESREIDRCVWNNMVMGECASRNTSSVVANHFTGDVCMKPWWCNARQHKTALCSEFTKRWWARSSTSAYPRQPC
eukprot:PhM_4_TR7521/c0_g1_i2/m.55202